MVLNCRSQLWLLATLLTTACAAADDPQPRVLILGDGVYQQHARGVVKELKGRVDVVFLTLEPGEVWNSETAIKRIDGLLEQNKWDLIHLNVGLGDLVYRAPQMKSFRALSKEGGGVRATSPEQYEKNLRALVKKIRAAGVPLIWASTTPIRSSPNGLFDLQSEKQYNTIAARVMTELKAPINDMYAFVAGEINMERPTSFDPFSFDRKPLHAPIVTAILDQLQIDTANSAKPSP